MNNVLNQKYIFFYIFLCLALHFLSTYFSIGFYSDDEHFQILEPIAYLLGLNDSLDLMPASGKTETAGSDFTFFQQVFSNLRSGRFATTE